MSFFRRSDFAISRRRLFLLHAALTACVAAVSPAAAQVAFTGSYSQNFNSLAFSSPPAWANNSTLPGWYAFGSGSAGSSGGRDGGTVNPAIAADFGNSTAGGLHSYGAAGQDERSLGSIGSGGASAGDLTYSVVLQNTTKETFRSTRINFAGEQWRQGGNNVPHLLVFDYAVVTAAPTSAELRADFTTGYIRPNSTFDFYSPVVSNGNPATAINGNQLATPEGLGGRLENIGGVLDVEWPAGSYLILRWWDDNDSGNDHGLAIDDLSVTASTESISHTITDAAGGGAVVDGVISENEYGPANSYIYYGSGFGLGGAVGLGSVRMNSDSQNLYVAFQPGTPLTDYAVIYLDTRVGGFDDAAMNDTGDIERTIASNLGSAGDDVFPIAADFALVIHPGGCRLLELTEGSFDPIDIVSASCGSGADTQAREFAIPLGVLGIKGGGNTVDFFTAYCTASQFNSNETIPAMPSVNAHANPGDTNIAVYTLINRFITESPCTPPQAPTSVTSSADIVCADDASSITLSAIGGSGQSVTWFAGSCDTVSIGSGETLIIASPGATTTYYARWETPGCGASTCASVTVTATNPPSVDAGIGSAVCVGASAALSGTGNNAAGFQWSGGAGVFGDANSLATTYTPGDGEIGPVVLTLAAIGSAPCADVFDTVTITINPPPTVDAGADATTCGGAAVNLAGSGANAASYRWSGGAGIFGDIFNPATTYSPGVGEPGPIVLTLTAFGLNGCVEATDAVSIDIGLPPTADAGSDIAACHGAPIQLNGAGLSAGFMWSGGAGSFADPTDPQTIYTPGPGESGAIALTLSTTGNAPCVEAADVVTVIIAAAPAAVHVDDDYSGLPNGTGVNFPHDGLPGPLVIGCNAFATIQDAHDAAIDGGTVSVASGVYTNAVSITKTLTILGAQAGVSGCDAARPAALESSIDAGGVSIGASEVVIDGFIIENATDGAAGISIDAAASGYDIRNNIIRANSIGLDANAEGKLASVIQLNRFDSNNSPGATSGVALTSTGATNALTISGNCFSGHAVASISITGAANSHTGLVISDNTFTAEAPIVLEGVASASIASNDFFDATSTSISIEGSTAGVSITENTADGGAAAFVRVFDRSNPPGSNADIEISSNSITCDASRLLSHTAILDMTDAAGAGTISNNTITLSGTFAHTSLHAIAVSGGASGSLNISGNVMTGVGLFGGSETAGVRLHESLVALSTVTIEENAIMGFRAGVHTQAAAATIINNRGDGSIAANDVGILVSGPTAAALIENNNLVFNTIAAIRIENGAIVDAGDCTGADITNLGSGSGPGGSSAGLNDLTGYGFDNAAPWAIENLNTKPSAPVNATFNSYGNGDIALVVRDIADEAGLAAVITSSSTGPLVVGNPSDAAACSGSTVQFTVQAINAASYQWRHMGEAIPDATSPVLELASIHASSAGAYDCVVTDVCGLSTVSVPAELAVFPLPSAPNEAAVDRNDFCADDKGMITLSAIGGAGDTVEWFAGSCAGDLIGAGSSLDIPSPSVTTTYFARWRSVCGFSGCVSVTVNVLETPTAPSSIEVDRPTICPGDTGSITLTASGGNGAALSWFAGSCDGKPIGKGATLTIPSPAVTTTYFARWENSCDASACAQATVFVVDSAAPVPDIAKLPVITGECSAIVASAPTATDACAGSIVGTTFDPLSYEAQGTFIITWTFDDGNGNITTQPQTVIVADVTPPVVVCRDATLTLDAFGNGVIMPGEVVESLSDNCGAAKIVSVVPDSFTCSNVGPNAVVVTVDDGNGNTSTCHATVNVVGSVSIVAPPESQTICERQNATFSIELSGSEGVTYQWRFNKSPIADATGPTLTIERATGDDAGSYDVVITTSCGSITSDSGVLTVEHCPVIFVNQNATGAGDGTSWADAFTRYEDALGVAISGDQIWVAAGTYRPDAGTGDRTATFQLRMGVASLGGFAGMETSSEERNPALNPTHLSGDIGAPDVATDNSFHVVNASGVGADCILDGFIIEHGNANSPTGDADKGAGILCIKGNLLIRGCTLRHNTAVRGGAIYIADAIPTIVGCDFHFNIATDGGGAIRAVTSALSLVNCSFMLNYAVDSGGAILNTGASDTSLVQCLLARNVASRGGAVANALGSFLSLNHCTIASNVAYDTAGGILITQASSSTGIANTIVYGNSDSLGGGEASQIRRVAGDLAIDYSCIQGLSGALGGVGNIGIDPMFVDADGPDNIPSTLDDDFRPGRFSSVIDAGSNALAALDDLDLDANGDTGEQLPIDLSGGVRRGDDPSVTDTGEGDAPVIDIGAYESVGLSCPCDFNRTGTLNSQDFFDFLNAFFDVEAEADFNEDGAINSQDFFNFLQCFFAAC